MAALGLGAGTSEEVLYRGLLPAQLVAAGLPVVGAIGAQAPEACSSRCCSTWRWT